MAPRTPADSKPTTLHVLPLEEGRQLTRRPTGRPHKLELPPLPQDILDGMTALEKKHFDHFIAAFREDFPNLTQAQLISLVQAAVEYINLLRVQAQQLKTGQVISMARQHPGVQLRAWLDSLGATRKQQKPDARDNEQERQLKEALSRLSS